MYGYTYIVKQECQKKEPPTPEGRRREQVCCLLGRSAQRDLEDGVTRLRVSAMRDLNAAELGDQEFLDGRLELQREEVHVCLRQDAVDDEAQDHLATQDAGGEARAVVPTQAAGNVPGSRVDQGSHWKVS